MSPNTGKEPKGRGCIYYNFGKVYVARLLVSVYSLRKHYAGPITVFLADDPTVNKLREVLQKLQVNVILKNDLSRSFDRHKLFFESPYETTLSFDSDMIFMRPIDHLWEPLERHGVLATRFHTPSHGIGGTHEKRGPFDRVDHLEGVRNLLAPKTFEIAMHRLVQEKIDVNIGVFGISLPRGAAFLNDWAAHMERGRGKNILLLDEMLVNGLLGIHDHYLADEAWNCPADEYFRYTNLADAKVIHYFGDGDTRLGSRMGRNPATWAGMLWFQMYKEASDIIDFGPWRTHDFTIANRRELFAHHFIPKKIRLAKRLSRNLMSLKK